MSDVCQIQKAVNWRPFDVADAGVTILGFHVTSYNSEIKIQWAC